MIRIRVPGEPRPHARPRFVRKTGHARTADKDLDWRGRAQVHMLEAVCKAAGVDPEDLNPFAPVLGVLEEAVRVTVTAVFTCPKSDHRKRSPRPRRWHTKRGDTDNIAKAVLDAGNGVLWNDDAQVADLHVTKLIGAQGEAPFVEIEVSPLNGEAP